jgi:membrane protein required for colicin V production
MSPLLFDLIIVVLVLLSLLLGFMRGFVNEVFTIIGWIGAVLATIYFTPVAKQYGEQLIHSKWMADLATASAIFMATLAIFSVVSHLATSTLKGSRLSLLDRIMGFTFGGLRAVVLLGLGFLLFAYVFEPDKRPDFVNNSHAAKFLETSAHWVQAVTPGLDNIQVSKDDPEPQKAKPEDTRTEDTPKIDDDKAKAEAIAEEKKAASQAMDKVIDKVNENKDKIMDKVIETKDKLNETKDTKDAK